LLYLVSTEEFFGATSSEGFVPLVPVVAS